jgi:tetratricopeptide (TPR) repeat protein
MLFEDARRDRRAMYEQKERDLIRLLSLNDVRRIGDSLERVERYAHDRLFHGASAAFNELYYRIPKASLNNSANAALTAIGKLKDYPEAEYWIGEVFRVEGELSLALSQYRRAYAMRDNLEDPGFSTVLRYKIAGIHRTRQEFIEMERTLFSIINDLDTLWINAIRGESTRAELGGAPVVSSRNPTPAIPYEQASASFARNAMTRTLENEGINRFLEMYRYNNIIVEEAHRLLGFYYVISGRPSAQQHLMFAFLIQNTVIIEELRRRRFDFTFTNLSALIQEVNANQLLLSFVDEVEYYKTAYYLGASLFRNGRTAVARNIWEFLAAQPQAGEWHSRAVSQLRNPRPEPIVEMP